MYNWFLQGKNIHKATYSFESPNKVNLCMDGCHFARWSYGGSPPWQNPNFMGKTLAPGDLQVVKY
jgi:hypothetical protein